MITRDDTFGISLKLIAALILVIFTGIAVNSIRVPKTRINAQSSKSLSAKGGPYKPGSNADDPAIWIHPTDRARSLMFLSDKDSGIYVYDFNGTQIQHINFNTSLNNIDVRKGFNYGDGYLVN